jgi:hypothetical protein
VGPVRGRRAADGGRSRDDRVRRQHGIDPFEILDLQIRPNAIIVLDSSGLHARGRGERQGPLRRRSQLEARSAKRVLKKIVDNNKDKISFQFGEYEHTNPSSAAYRRRSSDNDRFIYATDDSTVSSWEVNRGGNGASQGGISRSGGSDDVTIGAKTYYYISTGKLFNGQTVDITNCTGGAARIAEVRTRRSRRRRFSAPSPGNALA